MLLFDKPKMAKQTIIIVQIKTPEKFSEQRQRGISRGEIVWRYHCLNSVVYTSFRLTMTLITLSVETEGSEQEK